MMMKIGIDCRNPLAYSSAMRMLECALDELQPGDELLLTARSYKRLAKRINQWRRRAYRRRYFSVSHEHGAVIIVLQKD